MKKRQYKNKKAREIEEEVEGRDMTQKAGIQYKAVKQNGAKKGRKKTQQGKQTADVCAYISVSAFINLWHSPTVINFVLQCFLVLFTKKKLMLSHFGEKKKVVILMLLSTAGCPELMTMALIIKYS